MTSSRPSASRLLSSCLQYNLLCLSSRINTTFSQCAHIFMCEGHVSSAACGISAHNYTSPHWISALYFQNYKQTWPCWICTWSRIKIHIWGNINHAGGWNILPTSHNSTLCASDHAAVWTTVWQAVIHVSWWTNEWRRHDSLITGSEGQSQLPLEALKVLLCHVNLRWRC